jgi:NADH-quinone oxidoreductase subunit M
MHGSYWLSALWLIPLFMALVIGVMPGRSEREKTIVRWATLVTFLVDFLVSLKLWFGFDPEQAGMQFTERVPWIEPFGIYYSLGVDGLSVLLVLLTTFLGPLVMAGAWRSVTERVKGFCVALLVLQAAMIGTFLALDIFLFYVFWEAMLPPMYFIIGVWGGERRIYAAIKLFVFTMVGSLLMLVAVLYLAITYGTFDVLELQRADVPLDAQRWLFLFFALAFAIKVPMFPFHTWLPDAHVEAPTAGSVILAGVLLKMGTYGFVRFAMPMFPGAVDLFSPAVCALAIVGIIYGALVAMVQPDVKKLVAYSSVSHLGYVMLGLFALNEQGIQGGILQMVNHGLSTGALFLLVGMIYERRHTRKIADFGGIARVMPVYAFFFMIITFSSIGLPGLNGFVGELLVLLGAFAFEPVYAVLASIGVILGAVYMLWMYRRVFFGPITHAENRGLKDLDGREVAILSAIVVLVVWIGVYPAPFLALTSRSVEGLIAHVEAGQLRARVAVGPQIRLMNYAPADGGRGRGVPAAQRPRRAPGELGVIEQVEPSAPPARPGLARPAPGDRPRIKLRPMRAKGPGVPERPAPPPRGEEREP